MFNHDSPFSAITIQTASFGRDRSDSVDSTSLTHFMENFFPSPELRVAERDLFETFNVSYSFGQGKSCAIAEFVHVQ